MGSPPYSSALTLNKPFLFPQKKTKSREHYFSSENTVDALKMHVFEVPQSK